MIDIRTQGAVGDGLTLDTAALQASIDACASRGGGTVVVPPGRWLTGALFLASGVELRIESGATLLGSRNFDDYPLVQSRC